MKLHFIQDVATPHNNSLLKSINNSGDVDLEIWYASESTSQYAFKDDLNNQIKKAQIYGTKFVNLKLALNFIFKRQEKYFIVGWANSTTRFIVILSWLLRFNYNIWFDYPNDKQKRSFLQHIAREFFYYLLKHSNAKVFCVGEVAINYFVKRKFSKERLVNLPIFNDLIQDKTVYVEKKEKISTKFNISSDDLFITSGSRLVYDKGFDILLKAIHNLPQDKQKRTKLLIVGKGEEKEHLKKLIDNYSLNQNVYIENWMDIEDFKACIAKSHVFVHPARFDAFGGGTLISMIVGTPVIGTYQGGSSNERIVEGENGWLYDAEDYKTLSTLISNCFNKKEQLKHMGDNALKTAQKWHPNIGTKIIKENIV